MLIDQFQNQLAAFPSLHFGYSFVMCAHHSGLIQHWADSISGLSLWSYSPHRIIRFVAPLYPLLILLVIMVRRCLSFGWLVSVAHDPQATANHYLLDAVGGFFVSLLAYRLNQVLLNLRPLEEWFFWVIRTEKPMDKAQYLSLLNSSSDSHLSNSQRSMTQRPLIRTASSSPE